MWHSFCNPHQRHTEINYLFKFKRLLFIPAIYGRKIRVIVAIEPFKWQKISNYSKALQILSSNISGKQLVIEMWDDSENKTKAKGWTLVHNWRKVFKSRNWRLMSESGKWSKNTFLSPLFLSNWFLLFFLLKQSNADVIRRNHKKVGYSSSFLS